MKKDIEKILQDIEKTKKKIKTLQAELEEKLEVEEVNFYKKYIGKYIRNQYGIAKILDIHRNKENSVIYLELDNDIVFDVCCETNEESDRFLRASFPLDATLLKLNKFNIDERAKDLIELIQVGDLVNDYKITDGTPISLDKKYILLKDNLKLYEKDIKTIIIKEELERMKYIVEENNVL